MQDTSSKQQTKQKYKPNHQQTGLPPHSDLSIRGKTNKNSAQISPYKKLTQTTEPTLLLLLLLSHFSRVRLFVTPETEAHQAPPSLGFSRQDYWSGLPFPSSNAWKWKVKVKSLSHVRPSATPWTAAFQAPPSMEFSRQEYWSGVPLPSPNQP